MSLPLNIDIQQILLHLLNFVLLFAILYFLLYSPVKAFMEKRKKHYDDIDSAAQDNFDASAKAKDEYETKLREASAKADEIMSAASEDAIKAKQDMIESARREADEIVAGAKKKAADEKARMLGEARDEITEIISEAAGKIVAGDEDVLGSFDAFLDQATQK